MRIEKSSLNIFEGLSVVVQKRLNSLIIPREYNVGETIFWQGEPADAIYLIASGRAKIVRVTREGNESILCIRSVGDYFCPVPLLDLGEQLGSAIAMTDVIVYTIDRLSFAGLCEEHPELLAVVQSDCLSEVRHLLNRMENYAYRSVRQRLASALLTVVEKQSRQKTEKNKIPLTHQELAHLSGSSRESISRNLAKMEAVGVVKTGRGWVEIIDTQQLKMIGRE